MGERATRRASSPASSSVLARRRRVLVEDARADGSYLRVTWHPDGGVFVVSTWREEVCTGAIRVPTSASADLISLFADGLADAATAPSPPATRTAAPTVWEAVDAKVRTWLGRRTTRRTTRRTASRTTNAVLTKLSARRSA